MKHTDQIDTVEIMTTPKQCAFMVQNKKEKKKKGGRYWSSSRTSSQEN